MRIAFYRRRVFAWARHRSQEAWGLDVFYFGCLALCAFCLVKALPLIRDVEWSDGETVLILLGMGMFFLWLPLRLARIRDEERKKKDSDE